MSSTNFGATSYTDDTSSVADDQCHQPATSTEPTVVCKIKKQLLGYDNVSYTDRYKDMEDGDASASVRSLGQRSGRDMITFKGAGYISHA